ncbi:hypothetical protein TeGR_g1177 [Tetraparma gracilis]|uniref:Kinesin-like protein n=1 Tax=Tetraparma gracilis TaxID=2962635 RepID=A0ABQ6MVP5_9STRA|nr:hypothetical protein TeGR_g1177 [Tetraparma gracilis]
MTVSMSVIEIYLERIVDLLDNSPGFKKPSSDMLKIREDASGGVYLEGVVETVITSPLNLLNCLENAGKKRATGGHAMNARSSRSHLVAILTLTTVRGGVTTVGKLSVCDLAGSEMVRKTEAEGQRLQEAKAINRSLSALGNVINALTLVKEGGGSGQQSHVPYRDSKLTRLLQDSLGGNAKTALIVTASVSSFNVSETLSTLRFGTRAKRLRNKPRVNAERTVGEYKKLLKDSDGKIKELLGMVQDLQAEVQTLKRRLDAAKKSGPPAGAARNVVRNLQAQEEEEEDDDDDDDEGLVWLPGNDEDLKLAAMESEEMENLRRKVDELNRVVDKYRGREEEREKDWQGELSRARQEGEEKLTKLKEDEDKVKVLMKQEMLGQYTRGWQVGQRAAGAAYSEKLEEDMKERDEEHARAGQQHEQPQQPQQPQQQQEGSGEGEGEEAALKLLHEREMKELKYALDRDGQRAKSSLKERLAARRAQKLAELAEGGASGEEVGAEVAKMDAKDEEELGNLAEKLQAEADGRIEEELARLKAQAEAESQAPENDADAPLSVDVAESTSNAEPEEAESFCQVCGLSELETEAHENVDENNPHKLGPLFTCDGNCNTFIHVSCAGLSCPPTGEWYCSDCSDVPIDDPLPSPMRVDQHENFDEAAAASLAELSAVRGRFVSLRKQRDRLLARWKGERETQRRVEMTKRKLRRKREEEILRLREVVLVLQEEIEMSDGDRQWLKDVMDSTVAMHDANVQMALELDAGTKSEYLQKANDIWETASKKMKDEVEVTSSQLGTVTKQFDSAKKQLMSQQRQIAKMQRIIQDQQKKMNGLEEAEGDRVVREKVDGVLEGSPFGPVASSGFSSAPTSPVPGGADGGGEAFKTMKNWWAGEEGGGEGGGGAGGGEDKKEAEGGARIEGVVKEKAEARSAPFRNRLIGLLSSIEKEAKDYNNLKERISVENKERRD